MKAMEVTAGLAASNGSLLLGGWYNATCGLIAYTPGPAPGPTLNNECVRPLPFISKGKSHDYFIIQNMFYFAKFTFKTRGHAQNVCRGSHITCLSKQIVEIKSSSIKGA